MEAPEGSLGGEEGHDGDLDGQKILDDQCGAGTRDGAGTIDVPEEQPLPAPVHVPVLLDPQGAWRCWRAELVISRPTVHLHELRWVDPDRDRLHSIFNHFLDDLAVLLTTMQQFRPPFPPCPC